MTPWNEFSYVPVIRTRDAELNGLREVEKSRLKSALPLIEFTRSRRSKSNPSASVSVSVSKTLEILEERPFIADVTSLDSQLNSDVSRLLDETNGFENWVEFVRENFGKQVIPVVHLTEPFDADLFRVQINQLRETQDSVALRIPTSYAYVDEVLKIASDELKANEFCVLLDAGYVKPDSARGAWSAILRMAKQVEKISTAALIPLASSFPSSVVADGYGEDAEGHFPLVEVEISDRLKNDFPLEAVKHGDYACIHPLDFEGTVTAWVPRVDIPLNNSLFYHRYRRPVGGYVTAAQAAIKDKRYVALNCWAHDNVVEAASGRPRGKSPAHWISVRLNYHLCRQIQRLSKV